MKNYVAILCLLSLPACSTLAPQPTPVVNPTPVVSLIPAAMAAKIKALVAKYPKAKPYLVTVANGLQSIAAADQKLPSPDSAAFTLLAWGGNIPEVGSYITEFLSLYRLYYSSIAPTAAALSEIAEIIREGTV